MVNTVKQMICILRKVAIAAFLCSAPANFALACSSCGSGGEEPVSLCPFEKVKLHLGISRSLGFQTVDSRGKVGTDGGPNSKSTLLFALGYSLHPTFFVTTLVPLLRNERNGTSKQGVGEPSVSAHWVANMQSIDEPWTPQIKATVGHKFAGHSAVQDSEDMHLLDVFGSGFAETKFGVEAWWGMFPEKFGVSYFKAISDHRHVDSVALEPGDFDRYATSLGYSFEDRFTAIAALVREQRREIRQDGVLVPESDVVSHNFAVTFDFKPTTPLETYRCSYGSRAAFSRNKNASKSQSLGLAYQRSL